MLLEVCIDSLESATNAVHNGADELEVCSDLANGGLTPSFELVKDVICMINNHIKTTESPENKVKVNVMIRANAGWDFQYSNNEIIQMTTDISEFKKLNIDRFVFGALTENRHIDKVTCKRILTAAAPTPVTFHRAFDVCTDPIIAINEIIKLGFTRILTSGQEDSAAHPKAIDLIETLHKNYGKEIEIMPGAGINADNIKIFKNMGCTIAHGTFKNGNMFVTNGDIVRKVKEFIG